MMPITLRQLSYFAALAETRSFGAAAARMSVSQPALSMQIRELEKTLGGALVDRMPRDVRLTRRGREVLERANRILAEVRELDGAIRRDGFGGGLNLGVIPTVAPYLMPEAIGTMQQNPTLASFRLREATTDRLLEELHNGRLDAIVIAKPASDNRLIVEDLFDDRFLLAGIKSRLATLSGGVESLRPIELDPNQLLLLDEGHCLADQALEVCALERRQMRVDLGASSLATLCRLVAADHGLTFLPEIAIEAECAAAPGLCVSRFTDPEPCRSLALVRRAATAPDAWFGALADSLRTSGLSLIARVRPKNRR